MNSILRLVVVATLSLFAIADSAPAATNANSVQQGFSGMWEVQPGHRPHGNDGPSPQPLPNEPKGLAPGDRRVRQMMTAAGRAAFDALDPRDLPANNCRSPGLPSIAMTPNLQEWKFTVDVLHIDHEYFSTKRQIFLDGRKHPDDIPHTAEGHAIGTIDGRTLVIETSLLAAMPGGLSRNAPGSDARVVTERYTLSEDGNSMHGRITIHDPKFLTRDINLEVKLVRAEPGTEIVFFPCDIESSRRDL